VGDPVGDDGSSCVGDDGVVRSLNFSVGEESARGDTWRLIEFDVTCIARPLYDNKKYTRSET